MSSHPTAIAVLLAFSVVTTLLCVLGMLLMKQFFEKLHYMAPVSIFGAGAILAAVALEEGWSQATIKTMLVFAMAVLMNAVLTHATARAARIRDLGHWRPTPSEDIAGLGEKGG